MGDRRHWVVVASRDHARRGVREGFIMANHGKRAPLRRMSRGDGILVYSPTTTYPRGEPLRAVTFVGEVTGDEPEPSEVIAGRAPACREPARGRAGAALGDPAAGHESGSAFEIDAADAEAILALVVERSG